MSDDGNGRTDGVRRWHDWLEKWFTATRLARIGETGDGHSGDIAWSVEIRYGKHGRIHVAGSALELDEARFDEAVRALERDDWYGRLEEWLCIRIDDRGRVRTVDRLTVKR